MSWIFERVAWWGNGKWLEVRLWKSQYLRWRNFVRVGIIRVAVCRQVEKRDRSERGLRNAWAGIECRIGLFAALGTGSHSRYLLFRFLGSRFGSGATHLRQFTNQRALGKRQAFPATTTPLVEGGDGGGSSRAASRG